MVKFDDDGIWTVTLAESIYDTRLSLAAIQRDYRFALKKKRNAKTPEEKRYWAGKANGLHDGYLRVREALLYMEHQEGR